MGELHFSQTVITSLTLVSLVSSELYHIVPTDSLSICANYTNGSCVTLPQFANLTLTSDVITLTLVFFPGEHALSQAIHISNIHNVSLIGHSKQPTLKGFGHGIRFKNISSTLYIANLKIIRDGQTFLSIEEVESVFVKNCHISGNIHSRALTHYSAIAISFADNVSISEAIFENNQMQYLTESSSGFDLIGGSVLSVYNSNIVLVKDSSFTNNSVKGVNISVNGGGIFLKDIEVVMLTNCTMKNNTILCNGCQNTTGGAISVVLAYRLVVNNSTFEENAVLNNHHLTENINGFGGAIYAEASVITVSGCTFLTNSAEIGGSIATMTSYGQISCTNNTHTNNFAVGFGGAIYVAGRTLTISNDHYHGNRAGAQGAAIQSNLVGGFTSIESYFTKNENFELDTGNGGTISVELANNGYCTVMDNTFVANWAINGAALIATLNDNCSYHSSTNQFVNNKVLMDGGAVFLVMNGLSISYNSSHNRFIGNVASFGSGGAIGYGFLYNSGHFSSSYNLFYSNIANKDGGAIKRFYDTNSNRGGLFLSSHNTFVNNRAKLNPVEELFTLKI